MSGARRAAFVAAICLGLTASCSAAPRGGLRTSVPARSLVTAVVAARHT